MKEKKIFDAITDIHDDIIEEAKVTKAKKRKDKRRWYKWLAIAVSVVLLVGIGLMIPKLSNINSDSGGISDVIYPKAYAFEDYDSEYEIREQNPVDDSFVKTLNDFSYKTGALILNKEEKNTNYSPLSLYYALSLAASGANNETEAEFLDLLGVSDTEYLSEQCGNLYRLLYTDNKIGKLKIADSIWMDNDMNGEPVNFKMGFVENAVKNFYASSHTVDFSKDDTGKVMAEWIANNTNGTLSPTFQTDAEQIMTILNTVYYSDQWINRFDKSKTVEGIFYLLDGSEVKNDFMNQTFSSASFAQGEGFTRGSLNLKNNGSMVFILPDEDISPYDLISSSEQIKEIFEGGEKFSGEVVWKIPKFSFDSKLDLSSVLKDIGLNSAFTSSADFSSITDHLAFITNISQETYIAIDEIGVEASAFTQIDYAGSAMPDGRAEMILNRPFIYGIELQGNILFIGVCVNPNE